MSVRTIQRGKDPRRKRESDYLPFWSSILVKRYVFVSEVETRSIIGTNSDVHPMK